VATINGIFFSSSLLFLPGSLLILPEGIVVGFCNFHGLLSNKNIRIPTNNKNSGTPPTPRTMRFLVGKGGYFEKLSMLSKTSDMTLEGLGEVFEGDSADTCAGKFPLMSMGGRANGQPFSPVVFPAIFFIVNGRKFAYSHNLLPLNCKRFCQGNLFTVSLWGKSYQAEIGKKGHILPASEGQLSQPNSA
jgi:hypothetical protein